MIENLTQYASQAVQFLSPYLSLVSSKSAELAFSAGKKLSERISTYCQQDCFPAMQKWGDFALSGAIVGAGIGISVGLIHNAHIKRVRARLERKSRLWTNIFNVLVSSKKGKMTPLDLNIMKVSVQAALAGSLIGTALFLKDALILGV